MKLWKGRFQKEADPKTNDFNSSISIDSRMYREEDVYKRQTCRLSSNTPPVMGFHYSTAGSTRFPPEEPLGPDAPVFLFFPVHCQTVPGPTAEKDYSSGERFFLPGASATAGVRAGPGQKRPGAQILPQSSC